MKDGRGPARTRRALSRGLVAAPLAALVPIGLAPRTSAAADSKRAPAPSARQASGEPAPPTFRGRISYYGHRFAGMLTAAGETFDPHGLTMAHRTLPFGTRVRVTNLRTGRSVVVTVNDRGPHTGGRVGDVSLGAARQLGMLRSGVVDAKLEVLDGVR